jgi:hypothetical protein
VNYSNTDPLMFQVGFEVRYFSIGFIALLLPQDLALSSSGLVHDEALWFLFLLLLTVEIVFYFWLVSNSNSLVTRIYSLPLMLLWKSLLTEIYSFPFALDYQSLLVEIYSLSSMLLDFSL